MDTVKRRDDPFPLLAGWLRACCCNMLQGSSELLVSSKNDKKIAMAASQFDLLTSMNR